MHAITGGVLAVGGNATEVQQFSSTDTGWFFLRAEVDADVDRDGFVEKLTPIGTHLNAQWQLVAAGTRTRTLVLASRSGHCLNDLLFQVHSGSLPIELPIVVSNHCDLAELTRFYGIGFEDHVVLPENKHDFEDRVRTLIRDLDIDLVVLARFMQVLSPELCAELPGRIINIHHSFLPGFKGANPYRQAHARGVKLIGATAHFVTQSLDEGPIIEQNVTRVDHAKSVADLVKMGQRLESATLTEAVRLYAEKRIFLDENRTVILR